MLEHPWYQGVTLYTISSGAGQNSKSYQRHLDLPLFVAAFVPSRNNLHGLLSCENYDSSTIRVTLSSLDSSFEDGLYSITSSEFGFSNQAIIKIPANVSWMNNGLQYSPPSSIDPFFQNYVPLTFKCKLTERYLTSTTKRQPCYSEQELKDFHWT